MFDLFGFGFKSDIEEAEEQTRSFREYLHREEIRILAEKIQRIEGRLEKIATKEPCKHEPKPGSSCRNSITGEVRWTQYYHKCIHCDSEIKATGWELS